eukprot:c45391_g1_i1 orf=199-471(-)
MQGFQAGGKHIYSHTNIGALRHNFHQAEHSGRDATIHEELSLPPCQNFGPTFLKTTQESTKSHKNRKILKSWPDLRRTPYTPPPCYWQNM